MFPSIRRALIGALVASLSLSAIEAANAYPDQPIKIIVTFPPGGSADIVIRALQPALSETLRQPAIERIRVLGAEPAPTSSEAFAKFVRSESAKWSKLIAEAGIKAQYDVRYPRLPAD